MKEPLTTLAFFVAVALLISLAVYWLVMWVVGGLVVGVNG